MQLFLQANDVVAILDVCGFAVLLIKRYLSAALFVIPFVVLGNFFLFILAALFPLRVCVRRSYLLGRRCLACVYTCSQDLCVELLRRGQVLYTKILNEFIVF